MFSARGLWLLDFQCSVVNVVMLWDERWAWISKAWAFRLNIKANHLHVWFTFMVWQHFYKKLLESGTNQFVKRYSYPWWWLENWHPKVSRMSSKLALTIVCNIEPKNICTILWAWLNRPAVQFIGAGVVTYMLLVSVMSLFVGQRFSLADVGEKGLIEVISVLPQSYPGHIL